MGYTSYRGSYWARGGGAINNRGAFMFITDVVLGNMRVANYSARSVDGIKYHSIFGKAGQSGVQNNEFVTFTDSSAYLRYLVELV